MESVNSRNVWNMQNFFEEIKGFSNHALVAFLLFVTYHLVFLTDATQIVNYYIPIAPVYLVSAILLAGVTSILFGVVMQYLVSEFPFVKLVKLKFYTFAYSLFLISLYLTLANTSSNLAKYLEMNDAFYSVFSISTLALYIPLSSLLFSNVLFTWVQSRSSNSTSAQGFLGIFANLFSMGCVSCGAFLYSLLGISGGLAALPFNGLGVRLLSLLILIYASLKLYKSECKSCYITPDTSTPPTTLFSNAQVLPIVFLGLLTIGLTGYVRYNTANLSVQVGAISSYNFAGSSLDLNVDLSKSTSTAETLLLVFPELKNGVDIMSEIFPQGTPEYSAALGGVSFDDPITSLEYLSKWYYSLKEDVKSNDPATWNRYLNLAAKPIGISCEFCCGVGPQGIDSEGNLRCGCQHNPALQAVTLGLMKYTDYSDAEVVREVMKWKMLFLPQDMVGLASSVMGKSPSQITKLPSMVGGC